MRFKVRNKETGEFVTPYTNYFNIDGKGVLQILNSEGEFEDASDKYVYELEEQDPTAEKQIIVGDVIIKPLPCPFCGSTDLFFTYETSYGHGNCAFSNARIKCRNCSGAKGDGSSYGSPSQEDELKAWKQWNERN